MVSGPKERSSYQLRLVKRIDGRKLVTHGKLAHAKSTQARDKTLDIFQASNDRAALQRAREYSNRSPQRKGSLPGDFRGVVVVKFVNDSAKPGVMRQRKAYGLPEVTNRRRRLPNTTTWLYYVDAAGDAHRVHPKAHVIENREH